MQPDTLLPTKTTVQFAARVAAERYGMKATAQALPGEYDDNFRLTTAEGTSFVLKIMHPARQKDVIDLQIGALQHLAARAPSLRLPRVCPSKAGAAIETVRDENGADRYTWMLTYIEGRPLFEAAPRLPELHESLGDFLGSMDQALADFEHPSARRDFKWDSARASWIRDYLHHIANPQRRGLVERFLALYETEVLPALGNLPHGAIHGDANDYNVITHAPQAQAPQVVSVIDFGDMHEGVTVSELAIAAAYTLLDQNDPLSVVTQMTAGYHRRRPLAEGEIAVLFPLIAARLCVSVVNSAHRGALAPDDPYITISERPAWAALEKLATIPPRLAHYALRAACGFPAVPHGAHVMQWLSENASAFAPVVPGLNNARVFDLSVGSLWTGADPQALTTANLGSRIADELRQAQASVGIGQYDEPRLLYSATQFAGSDNPTDERRTVHLGLDLFARPGTTVSAPLAGRVHAFANNAAAQDYGPVIILRHETDQGVPFFTLYGHLSVQSLDGLAVGQWIDKGQALGSIGEETVNGGWPTHVHVQIILDLLDLGTDFPGVGFASQRELWRSLSPDPGAVAGIPRGLLPKVPTTSAETLAERKHLLGGNLSISYRKPLKMVRGWKQYLYDENGRAYLDAYNNVPLVGHSHPRVVRAAQQQLALLNTNTRYLHDNIVRYAQRLTALMPEPLRVCYFLNSASEANELALRLARAHTRRNDIMVLEHAYHGHTNALIDISPYKFDGPGGTGRKPWVHVAAIADDYRGPYKRGDFDVGLKYAAHVQQLIAEGVSPAAFIAETLPSVGGQIVFPPGYLARVYEFVRAAGGVCIADEVQVGFGRLGKHFWGFASQQVVPDIVVLGKPIGNAFPLAALVTTPEIAASFNNGMEFFSTFGGNPVACAAGLAVLDVLQEEQLPENAERIGSQLRSRLDALMKRHRLIGDVRGMGLFLGVELVRDRATLEPADVEASFVVNRLRERGILTGTDGPHHNVIKIRPPLCFSERDADLFASTLDQVLAENGLN